MPTPPCEPACPECGYDLTGVIAAEGFAHCPECGRWLTWATATAPRDRWRTVRWAAIVLLGVPLPIAAASYWLFAASTTLDYFLLGFLPPVFMGLYIPVAVVCLLVVDARRRGRNKGRRRRLPWWASVLLILAMGSVSMAACVRVAILWLEALASV